MKNDTQALCRCTKCGNEQKINIYQRINVAANPELKEKVKNGSLFIWECPKCGKINLAKYSILYHDPQEKLMIWLLPKGESVDKQIKIADGQTDLLEEYTLRKVNDISSLIEKVNIADAGLDDIVMEMCKYVTKMEIGEKEPDKLKKGNILDTEFRFYKMNGPDNEIAFSFATEGQLQGLNIGFNVYEDCRRILQRNPSIRPEPGFVKIDAAWLATRIR
jgi:DNA-directed RNA polymerase subunit M/transcription elongation factor TFIIS